MVTERHKGWLHRAWALIEGHRLGAVAASDAYGRRCAVTCERSLPTLDAAHIQPYRGPRSNHLQNGLVLRADIHRLFDSGYVTVTPEYRFRSASG
jgi:predicted restriction endonuclease